MSACLILSHDCSQVEKTVHCSGSHDNGNSVTTPSALRHHWQPCVRAEHVTGGPQWRSVLKCMKYVVMGSQLWLALWNKSLKLTQFSPLPLEAWTVGNTMDSKNRNWLCKIGIGVCFQGSFLSKGTAHSYSAFMRGSMSSVGKIRLFVTKNTLQSRLMSVAEP